MRVDVLELGDGSLHQDGTVPIIVRIEPVVRQGRRGDDGGPEQGSGAHAADSATMISAHTISSLYKMTKYIAPVSLWISA